MSHQKLEEGDVLTIGIHPHVDILSKIEKLSCGQGLIVTYLMVTIKNELQARTFQGNLMENSVREMMVDLNQGYQQCLVF